MKNSVLPFVPSYCKNLLRRMVPAMVKFTLSIDTSTPALIETSPATLAVMLTWAVMFSTIKEILSTLKFGTLSQTSGGLLISNGRAVHVEFLFVGHADGSLCGDTKVRLETINSAIKEEAVGKQPLEVIDVEYMNVHRLSSSIWMFLSSLIHSPWETRQ